MRQPRTPAIVLSPLGSPLTSQLPQGRCRQARACVSVVPTFRCIYPLLKRGALFRRVAIQHPDPFVPAPFPA